MAKTALVTGASGGIGKSIAQCMAADGVHLIITARQIDRLEVIARDWQSRYGVTVTPIQSDLAQAGGAQKLFDDIAARGLRIDYLVNNAGVGLFGFFRQLPVDNIVELLTLNMISLTMLTRLFLEQIVAARGKIMNVSSMAGFVSGPYMANYFATKAYVLSFSQALAYELKDTGVTVTTLCPGVTKSGFFDQAQMHDSGLVKRFKLPTADEVGAAAYRAMLRGRGTYVVGRLNRLLIFFVPLVPRRLVTMISALITAPVKSGK